MSLSTDRFNPVLDYVPQRFRDAFLEQLNPGLQAVIAESDDRRGLLLYGLTGRGKTHAMAAIANPTWNKRMDPAARGWIDWDEFCRDMRAFWDLQKAHAQDARFFDPIAWAIRRETLYIDDLGQERDEHGPDHFRAIVAGRYDARRGLCVTTNLTLEQIGERYGGKVFSRLNECCEPIELGGVDRRLRATG